MTSAKTFLSFMLGSTMMTACAGFAPEDTSTDAREASVMAEVPESVVGENLLPSAWSPGDEFTGPYGGVPAFDKMSIALIEPALKKGMAEPRSWRTLLRVSGPR